MPFDGIFNATKNQMWQRLFQRLLYLLSDLGRNGVIRVRLYVTKPSVCRAEKVLVLDVKEILGVPDHLDVGL
jgi:hypothetical protein